MANRDSEKLLRELLTRRQLLVGIGGMALGASALSLIGCGGGGSGAMTGVNASVSLPTGSSLSLGGLTVDVLGATSPVSSSGAFSAQVGTDSPCLAILSDSAGNGVLMGFLDPNSSNHTISARTTASALIFCALGAYLLPASAMTHALELIDGHSATSTLENVIAGAVAANPNALPSNETAIPTAVAAAVNSILGSASLQKRGEKQKVAKKDSGTPTQLLINPSNGQTGVDVTQPDNSSSIVLTNNYRRHCIAYLYEVGTLTGANTVDISPAKRVAGPITLDSVENLSLWTAAKDFFTFFHGTAPWTPVSTAPIPLPLDGASDRTTYNLVVLGSSFGAPAASNEPSFFSDPHFLNETATWRQDVFNLFVASLLGDIFFPLVCMLGGFGAIGITQSALAGIAVGATTSYSQNFLNIMKAVVKGQTNVAPSIVLLVQDALLNKTTQANLSADVAKVVSGAKATAVKQVTQAQFAARLGKGLSMFKGLSPIFAVGALLEAGDLGKTILDVATADLGDIWTGLTIKQVLKLTPVNPTVAPGSTVTFTIAPPANVTGTFEYDWTQNGTFSTFSSHGGVVGNKITTKDSDRIVDLVTTPSDQTNITVSVIGYNTSSGTRVEIGRASTLVTLGQKFTLTPATLNVAADTGTQFTLSPSSGTLPGGGSYVWTLTGKGSLATGKTTSTITTSQPQVSYLAPYLAGTDSLMVTVKDSAGATLGTATAPITITSPYSISFTDSTGGFGNQVGAESLFVVGTATPAVPSFGSDDILEIHWNTNTIQGVAMLIQRQPGVPLKRGQVFTQGATGPAGHGYGYTPGPGHYFYWDIGAFTGSVTVTSVTVNPDGTTTFSFDFAQRGVGYTFAGSGTALVGPDGSSGVPPF